MSRIYNILKNIISPKRRGEEQKKRKKIPEMLPADGQPQRREIIHAVRHKCATHFPITTRRPKNWTLNKKNTTQTHSSIGVYVIIVHKCINTTYYTSC